MHAGYAAKLVTMTVSEDDTRVAYACRVRQYLAWLAHTDIYGDPLATPAARDKLRGLMVSYWEAPG